MRGEMRAINLKPKDGRQLSFSTARFINDRKREREGGGRGRVRGGMGEETVREEEGSERERKRKKERDREKLTIEEIGKTIIFPPEYIYF